MDAKPHVCPVWVGYLMSSPLRMLQQHPYKILKPYVEPGMKVLEIGPAMGFFSIPMARLVKPEGTIYCVDIQEKMLKSLEKKAIRKKLDHSIETIVASPDSSNIDRLNNQIDFCLLAYVLHEIPDQERLFKELSASLKKGAKILYLEPKGHVKEDAWKASLELAQRCGFKVLPNVIVTGSRACELVK